jgi:hypothetical protein
MRLFRKRPPGWGHDYEHEAFPGACAPIQDGGSRFGTLVILTIAAFFLLAVFAGLAFGLRDYEPTKGGLPDDYFRQVHLQAWELEQQEAATR